MLREEIGIDLVVVDGNQSLKRIELLIKIAENSLRRIKFNCVKIFTGYRDTTRLPKSEGIEYIYVSISSIEEYSRFVIQDLHNYIVSNHCLIFQYDGFIVNPENWDFNFLKYDYIGAVWPDRCWNKINRVGNGGFSLRSKKLMEFCSKLNHDEPMNEDEMICVKFYDQLVSSQYLIAPPEVACKFSLENSTEYNDDLSKAFGFHGSLRAPHLYSRTLELIKVACRNNGGHKNR